MKQILQLIIIFSLLGPHAFQQSVVAGENKLLVVTNYEHLESLSKNQIRRIYLAGGINIPVKPLAFKSGDALRSIFNIKIIGLTESRIEAYWAQMKFTGKVNPPKEFSNIDSLLTFLEKNKGFVAYLPGDTELPEWLKVVYVINY